MTEDKVVALKECARCKQAIRIVQTKDDREMAVERPSGERHVCWDLPQDANLVVIDD